MEKIFFISMESLFPTLFWGNTIALLFLLLYRYQKTFSRERNVLVFLIFARLCHAFYYCVATGRGMLPDWLSVNLGNMMLFIGFYFEAQAILSIIKENTRFADRMLLFVLGTAIIVFNILEYIMPTGGIRIASASICVVAIMALPNIRMLFTKKTSVFVKPTAILYSFFLLCLLMRAWYGLYNHNATLLATNTLHSLTFLALLLQLIISLPAYALILKDYAEEELFLMATTDKLTGAANRHVFLNTASTMYRNCKLFRTSLSVLFIDIDHFKQVNDQYGHAFGDCVLTRMAAIIDKCLRGNDLSCRYGGEEFVALLPRSDCAAAQLVAQRIMDEVRRARFDDRPDFAFTVSIGVFCGIPPLDQSTIDAAIHKADEALYQAKRSGRDRIVIHAPRVQSHTGLPLCI